MFVAVGVSAVPVRWVAMPRDPEWLYFLMVSAFCGTTMIAINPEPAPLRVDSHGVVRVGNTRVTLDTVVFAFQEGLSAEEIVHQYPSLDLGDVYAVISYYLKRREEVESYLADRQSQAEEVQRRHEARFNPVGLRERLLARRRSGS